MDNVVPEQLKGRYFPAGKSASLDAMLHDEAGELIVTLTAGARIPVVFDRLSDRIGNLPRKLYFKDGSLFECTDNDDVDLAFGKTRQFATQLTRWESSWKLVLVATICLMVSIWGFYRWGIPAVATAAAYATPSPVLAAIDVGARDTVDRVLFSESNLDDDRKRELTTLFEEIAVASGHEEPPVKLMFRDGGRLGANAVALPGGTVVLTDQLEALIENDDEIAGVFAHEIGHIHERHSLRQIYRVLGLTFMIAMIGGDSGQIVEEVLGQVVLLETFSYSRSFELSADAYAARVMLDAGRDPLAFVGLLDRVYENAGIDPSKETSWFSTHPGNEDRREHVKRLLNR